MIIKQEGQPFQLLKDKKPRNMSMDKILFVPYELALKTKDMEGKLIKTKVGYHLWLNPETKEQEHIASNYEIINDNGVELRKYKLACLEKLISIVESKSE